MSEGRELWDAVIVGGGVSGLSAAVYLGRRLLIDAGHSMAIWEPVVENYLGFPEGLSGRSLLDRGKAQVRRFGAHIKEDGIVLRRTPSLSRE